MTPFPDSRTRRAATFSIAVLALLAASSFFGPGCVTDPVTGESKFALFQWSVEEEQELGQAFAPAIQSQFDGVYTDPVAHQYLDNLIREMASHSVRADDFEYRFQILNSSIPNAFALPGGFVYITRGLLHQLETEAQFISIMGHELGHVEHQHAMLGQTRSVLAGIGTVGLGVLGAHLAENSEYGKVIGLATVGLAAAPGLIVLKYSRDQELEADRRGVYFASTMGYDPRDGVKTFELFQRMEEESGGGAPISVFRTHPLNEDRIDGLKDVISEDYPGVARKSDFRDGANNFSQITDSVRQREHAYEVYDQTMQALAAGDATPQQLTRLDQELQEAEKIAQGDPLFKIARGEIALLEEDNSRARSLFTRALQEYEQFNPEHTHWKSHYYLGLMDVRAQDGASAEPHLQRAVEEFPTHPEPYYYLGQAHELNGQNGDAVESYEAVLTLVPEDQPLYQKANDRLLALRPPAAESQPASSNP
jgi:predicted Zn-dependent protease